MRVKIFDLDKISEISVTETFLSIINCNYKSSFKFTTVASGKLNTNIVPPSIALIYQNASSKLLIPSFDKIMNQNQLYKN